MRPRRRLISAEEQRLQLIRDGNLAAFTQHPAWPDLKQAISDREQEIHSWIIAYTLSRSHPVDQREVDLRIGFIQGMKFMVKVCEGAESHVETYLKEQARAEGSA